MEGKELIKRRFGGNLEGYDRHSVVQRFVCERIDSLMERHVKDVPAGVFVELGAGTGFMTRYLVNRFPGARWLINDIVPSTETFLSPIISNRDAECVWCDAENMPLREDTALVVSASAFQWFERLDVFLKRIYKDILPGGYLIFSSFGEDNFYQIREASEGRKGIRFPSFAAVAEWVSSAGYEILHSESSHEDMWFGSVREMLEYMKHTGVNGTSDGRWSKSEYVSFCGNYENMFGECGKVKLTYNPFIIIARKAVNSNNEDVK